MTNNFLCLYTTGVKVLVCHMLCQSTVKSLNVIHISQHQLNPWRLKSFYVSIIGNRKATIT